MEQIKTVKYSPGKFYLHLTLILTFFFIQFEGLAVEPEHEAIACYAELRNDTLVMGNASFERRYLWNAGNLITISWTDKIAEITYSFSEPTPDLFLPGESIVSSASDLVIESCTASSQWNRHLSVEVTCQLGYLSVKRLFRIFPETPAVQCTYYFKGKAASQWIGEIANPGNLSNIETYSNASVGASFAPVLDRVRFPGVNWSVKTVQFYDITDRYNTFCVEKEELVYRMNIHKGNIAILQNHENQARFFMLKEAPSWFSQLAYPGADFVTATGKIQAVGIGVDSADVQEDEWVRGYGIVTGFGGKSEVNVLTSIRKYQKNIFPGYERYEPIFITNTWGDRGKDTKINESFIKEEILAAGKLGSNYLQIDDGWMSGRSKNSAFEGGTSENLWEREGYWNVHPEKFPDGLEPILKSARKSRVGISLWFSPSIGEAYKDWERDAETLTGLYQDYGITKVKIDLLQLNDKLSETRIRNLLDYCVEHSGGQLSFDLDITANKRFGYHYFNEYGVYWVANRYTDWRNYYPHTTLRNLWLLSRYVPPEKLQMAFCNIWRNTGNYEGDLFAPSKVGFDYAFATVMAAQPMGFFETSGLPEAAFDISPVVDSYLSVQNEFHSGVILPVGEMPSGRSWTGFQSICNENTGYLLIYRELNERPVVSIQTYLQEESLIKLSKIAGSGQDKVVRSGVAGRIQISLENPNSWVLYSYEVSSE